MSAGLVWSPARVQIHGKPQCRAGIANSGFQIREIAAAVLVANFRFFMFENPIENHDVTTPSS
jgi:hypothetical protein